MKPMKVICVDFDGVLHDATGNPWRGNHIIEGRPMKGALEWLESIRAHYIVVIHSCRSSSVGGREAMREWLRLHMADTFNIYIAEHKPYAHVYIDDRAMLFRPEDGFPTISSLHRFSSWAQTMPVAKEIG